MSTWNPLGKVWDIERDAKRSPKSAWQLEYRIPANNPTDTRFARGITSPEILFARNTCWIAYSMNGRGTGLLKSSSGKPEGPYEDLGRLTGMGGSPSLFLEEGAESLWLWGDLRAARLNEEFSAIEGPAPSLLLALERPASLIWDARAYLDFWDVDAPHLFAAVNPSDGTRQHYLTWSAVTQRHGRALRETLIARSLSDSPVGPYGAPNLMVPHGGQTSVFEGPDDALNASFYGADPMAAFRDRPALVPILFRPGLTPGDVPVKVMGDFYTNRGSWEKMQPIIETGLIDFGLTSLPDGYVYVGCSNQNRADAHAKVPVWRSKDPMTPHWEELILLTREQIESDPRWPVQDPPLPDTAWKARDSVGTSWIARLYYLKGDYFLSTFMTGVKGKVMEPMFLKSTSGKAQGQYAFHGRTRIESLLEDDDGTFYAIPAAAVLSICRLTDDLTGRVPNSVFRIRIHDYTEAANDCGCALAKVDGKYLWMGLNCYGAYDQTWYWSDRVDGVYRPVSVLPYTGNGNIVEHNGRFYTSNQSSGYENPTQDSFIWPLHVDMKSDPPVIEHQFEHEAGVREMSVY